METFYLIIVSAGKDSKSNLFNWLHVLGVNVIKDLVLFSVTLCQSSNT